MYTTPLGSLWLQTRDQTISSLSWFKPVDVNHLPDPDLQAEVGVWLDAYFRGSFLPVKSLPLSPAGTSFQKRVWAALATIPLGRTVTYGALATEVQSAPRAVGRALGRNPIPLLIPCHRVVAANGLGGYSGGGGVESKRLLLQLEGVQLMPSNS